MFTFNTTGRQVDYLIDNGVCVIFKLKKGFEVEYSNDYLTTDELMELNNRFNSFTINVGKTVYQDGFATCTLGTGKALWYIGNDDIEIVNIIESKVKREKLGMKFE